MKSILFAIMFLAIPVSSNEPKYDMNVSFEFKGLALKRIVEIEKMLNERFPDAKIIISIDSEKIMPEGIMYPGNWKFNGPYPIIVTQLDSIRLN